MLAPHASCSDRPRTATNTVSSSEVDRALCKAGWEELGSGSLWDRLRVALQGQGRSTSVPAKYPSSQPSGSRWTRFSAPEKAGNVNQPHIGHSLSEHAKKDGDSFYIAAAVIEVTCTQSTEETKESKPIPNLAPIAARGQTKHSESCAADSLRSSSHTPSTALSPKVTKIASWMAKAACLKQMTFIDDKLIDQIRTDRIQRVDLSHRGIDNDRFLCAMLHPLALNTSVTELDLSFNKLNTLALTALAHVLGSAQTNISKLKLSNTKIGDEGLQRLAFGLAANNTVVHLDVSECGITSQGLSSFATTLLARKREGSLIEFILRGNQLSDSGMAQLGELLIKESVVRVDLGTSASGQANSISHNGVRKMASAIGAAGSKVNLRQLRLTGNPLKRKAGKRALQLLQSQCEGCHIEFLH